MNQLEFFLPMVPPTVTHQEQQVRIIYRRLDNGTKKPIPQIYEPPELAAARSKLCAHLSEHAPQDPMEGPLRLVVKWCFPAANGKHRNGEYKTTRPDTDNLNKMFKDCMTKLHFWQDDAQVASEIIEKFWADLPGIYVCITRLEDQD